MKEIRRFLGARVGKQLRIVPEIAFFVDDVLVYTFQPEVKNENTWPYNQPFYFIINVAIGGNFGGPAIDNTILPQEFIVDYIKVYQ